MKLTVRQNLGTIDRIVRAVVGIYLLTTALSSAVLPLWGYVLLLALGFGFLLEAATGY